MKTVWVLWWSYQDGSASKVVRVYKDESEAQMELDMLIENTESSCDWKITEVPILKDLRTLERGNDGATER